MKKEQSLFDRFFVDKHDGLRKFFRYTFLAGCHTVEEYERYCGLKKSNINTFLIPKLKEIMTQDGEKINPKKNVIKKTERKKKKTLCIWDPNPGWFQDGGSFIWKTFKMRTVKASHVLAYFHILSELTNRKDGISDYDLRDSIDEKFSYLEDALESLEERYKVLVPFTASNRIGELLVEMIENGLIEEKDKKRFATENILHELSDSQQKELFYLAQFYAKLSTYSVPGYYFMDSLLEYQKQKTADYTMQWPEIFCFQNDYFYQMVDEDVLWKLYIAWKEEHLVKVRYLKALRFPKKQEKDQKKFWYQTEAAESEELVIYPLQVLNTDVYGRKNVLVQVFDDVMHLNRQKKNRLQVLRIDRIESMEFLQPVEIEENGKRTGTRRKKTASGLLSDEYNVKNFSFARLKEQYSDILQYSWNGSGLSSASAQKKETMVVEFDFTAYPFREKQLLLEKKHGILESLAPHQYRLTIELSNQQEIMPWIYSFGSTAKVIECSDRIMTNNLMKRPEEVLKNYGIISEV